MRDSGAGWLRLTLLNGVWRFTPWGRAPLADKLVTLRDALVAELGPHAPLGVVVSSAAGRYDGDVREESVRIDRRTFGLRRPVSPGRARETLIVAFEDARHTVGNWVDLADAERDWLHWALAKQNVPSWQQIVSETG